LPSHSPLRACDDVIQFTSAWYVNICGFTLSRALTVDLTFGNVTTTSCDHMKEIHHADTWLVSRVQFPVIPWLLRHPLPDTSCS